VKLWVSFWPDALKGICKVLNLFPFIRLTQVAQIYSIDERNINLFGTLYAAQLINVAVIKITSNPFNLTR
jgi:hypothetical protein